MKRYKFLGFFFVLLGLCSVVSAILQIRFYSDYLQFSFQTLLAGMLLWGGVELWLIKKVEVET